MTTSSNSISGVYPVTFSFTPRYPQWIPPNVVNPPHWATKPKDISQIREELLTTNVIAVDLESDRLYRYYPRTTLIQLNIAEKIWLIDPLRLKKRTLTKFLQQIFSNPRITKVFHDGRQDIADLKREFNVRVKNIFDTSIAMRCMGHSFLGLEKVVKHYFGITLNKKSQKKNWGKRPLPTDMVLYAQLDVHFLPTLYHILTFELQKAGRLALAHELFEFTERTQPQKVTVNYELYQAVLQQNPDLTPRQQLLLRRLWILHEKMAEKVDRPPWFLFRKEQLVKIVKILPKTEDELKKMFPHIERHPKMFPKDLLHQFIETIKSIDALPEKKVLTLYKKEIENAPLISMKKRWITEKKNKNDVKFTPMQKKFYYILIETRKRLAEDFSLDPDIIASKEALKEMARLGLKNLYRRPRIKDFGLAHWELFGDRLLQIAENLSHSSFFEDKD